MTAMQDILAASQDTWQLVAGAIIFLILTIFSQIKKAGQKKSQAPSAPPRPTSQAPQRQAGPHGPPRQPAEQQPPARRSATVEHFRRTMAEAMGIELPESSAPPSQPPQHQPAQTGQEAPRRAGYTQEAAHQPMQTGQEAAPRRGGYTQEAAHHPAQTGQETTSHRAGYTQEAAHRAAAPPAPPPQRRQAIAADQQKAAHAASARHPIPVAQASIHEQMEHLTPMSRQPVEAQPQQIDVDFASRDQARRAILYYEIFSAPKALRPEAERWEL